VPPPPPPPLLLLLLLLLLSPTPSLTHVLGHHGNRKYH
jgi:hypothetical protein